MHPSKSSRKSCISNIAWCLLKRQQNRLSCEEQREILRYGEYQTTQTRRAISCKLPGTPISTFFLAFSPDGETVASGHGDHSVRISEVKSGRCLHVLEGHPRSPWCVVFHPSNPHLLASGCLKGIVNVWDLTLKDSKLISSLNCHGVTSIAFHPSDTVLLVATGNQLMFWSWYQSEPFAMVKSSSVDEIIRLVKFDSLGHHILTGIHDLESFLTENVEATVDRAIAQAATERTGSVTINQSTSVWRLQWWDFTHMEIPDLQKSDFNVIARDCRLYNNISADISADGRLLSALVVKVEGRTDVVGKVCVFSLEQKSLGQCLFSTTLVDNTFSTCFSPLGTHLLVGVACDNRLALFHEDDPEDRTMAYIFKLCEKDDDCSENAIKPLKQVASLKLRKSGEGRFSTLRANTAVWHPLVEYGLIAFGTNRGEVFLCHV